MIDNLLQICFRGTFEKLEVAVRVGVLTCERSVLHLRCFILGSSELFLVKYFKNYFQLKDMKYLIIKHIEQIYQKGLLSCDVSIMLTCCEYVIVMSCSHESVRT